MASRVRAPRVFQRDDKVLAHASEIRRNLPTRARLPFQLSHLLQSCNMDRLKMVTEVSPFSRQNSQCSTTTTDRMADGDELRPHYFQKADRHWRLIVAGRRCLGLPSRSTVYTAG